MRTKLLRTFLLPRRGLAPNHARRRIEYRGEHFLLTKGGLPVAELRPVTAARIVTGRDLAGRLPAMPHLGPAAASRFADDIEKARVQLDGNTAIP